MIRPKVCSRRMRIGDIETWVIGVELESLWAPMVDWDEAIEWACWLVRQGAEADARNRELRSGPGSYVVIWDSPRGVLYLKNPVVRHRHSWTPDIEQAYGWETRSDAVSARDALPIGWCRESRIVHRSVIRPRPAPRKRCPECSLGVQIGPDGRPTHKLDCSRRGR